MQITVYRPSTKQQLGPFLTETVRAMLGRGELSNDDLIHYEGLSQWTPISQLPSVDVPRVPLPPRSITPPISPSLPPLTLEARVSAIETRLNRSNLHSPKFWSRAFTVWGHQLAAIVAVYAVLMVIAIIFILIGTVIQHLGK